MKILYITRHFNHSGYHVLESLINSNFIIGGVLVKKEFSFYKTPFIRHFFFFLYRLKCWYYRCDKLKNLKSEELLAKKHGLKIIKEKSIKSNSFYKKLISLDPDIIVLGGGWHELLPKRVFSYPQLGCINTHPSLLPMFRGTSITRWQVLSGVRISGSTIHFVDGTFDTGGVLSQEKIKIERTTSPQTLFYELGLLGAKIMIPLLEKFNNNGKPKEFFPEHDENYYKYFKKWDWSEKKLIIDWNKDFESIHYFILANTQESYEYKGPIFLFKGQLYFVRKANLINLGEIDFEANNYLDGNIHIVHKSNKSIFLFRKDEKKLLEIKLIQRFDRFYKIRRAFHPISSKKFKVGDTIIY